MIRTTIIFIWTIFMTGVLGIVAITLSFFSKSGNMPHTVARFWSKSILFISRVKVKIHGISNINPAESYVFMVNHQSNFDIPVLMGSLPVQFRWLAKAELFKIPIFGRGMKGCGYISIDRSNRREAYKSLKRASETIQNGTSVLIFPEGTRSEDGKIRPFKKGGFILTIDAGVPIIPVILYGTFSIMPKNRMLIKPRHVYMKILKPIETKGYKLSEKDELKDRVRQVMVEAFNQNHEDG